MEREKRESERKQIEAEGIRDFQQTVTPGRDFRLLSALARHRGDAAALAIDEFQGRGHRQRQGRLADHPRQCRFRAAPPQTRGSPAIENDTAPKGGPTAAGPAAPMEKTPAAALTTPSEKTPTASPTTPSAGTAEKPRARMAAQPVRYRSLPLPVDTPGGAEDRCRIKTATGKTARSAAAIAAPELDLIVTIDDPTGEVWPSVATAHACRKRSPRRLLFLENLGSFRQLDLLIEYFL